MYINLDLNEFYKDEYSKLESIYEHVSKRINKSLTRECKDKKIII